MKIHDFRSEVDVVSEQDLGVAMAQRFGGKANLFWLYHAPSKYPALTIRINGDWAVLNYFPEERQAGFVSQGENNLQGLDGFTNFPSNESGEEDLIPSRQIVSVAEAYEAAKEFLNNSVLPRSIKWFEL